VAPDRVLFVAGSPYDAEGARAAGTQAVYLRRRDDLPLPGDVATWTSLSDVVADLRG
jgi:FMN phosphatase YigB (HAD superfamily)